LTINERFLSKYEFLESLLKKIFFPKDNSFDVVSILEKLIIAPHSTRLISLRKKKDSLLHSSHIKNSKTFFINYQVEEQLDEIITYVQSNEASLHDLYIKEYIYSNGYHNKKSNKESATEKQGFRQPLSDNPIAKKERARKRESWFLIFKALSKVFGWITKMTDKRPSYRNSYLKYDDENTKIKETIRVIRDWSNADKTAILTAYNKKRRTFKSLNKQLAEVLVKAKAKIE
jgi:hypothetical protein